MRQIIQLELDGRIGLYALCNDGTVLIFFPPEYGPNGLVTQKARWQVLDADVPQPPEYNTPSNSSTYGLEKRSGGAG